MYIYICIIKDASLIVRVYIIYISIRKANYARAQIRCAVVYSRCLLNSRATYSVTIIFLVPHLTANPERTRALDSNGAGR